MGGCVADVLVLVVGVLGGDGVAVGGEGALCLLALDEGVLGGVSLPGCVEVVGGIGVLLPGFCQGFAGGEEVLQGLGVVSEVEGRESGCEVFWRRMRRVVSG